MNVVRYCLCFFILATHTFKLSGISMPRMESCIATAVGCFFTLSGFLMFPPFQKRPTLRHYIRKRALRILPPYIFIVLLCALLLSFTSTLPAREYFTDSGFWKYLAANLSFLNFLHPDLPGVFVGDMFVTNAVNGSLWTMKGEWICYLSEPFVFMLIKRASGKGGAILGGVTAALILIRLLLLCMSEASGSEFYDIIARQFGVVLIYFYIGALLNYYYPLLMRYKWWILAFDLIVIALGDYIPNYHVALQPIATGSLVILVSMVGKWGTRLSRHDNVSYDIYLFHFPIIQLCVLYGLPQKMPHIALLLIVAAATVILALISWNLVGKRFNAITSRHKKEKEAS